VSAPAVRAPERNRSWVQAIAAGWSYLFLILLCIFFEVWARVAFGASFMFNLTNIQSIALATVQPLLLGLGLTLVIIAGGIDLSVGFTVGLASVIAARAMQVFDPSLPPLVSFLLGAVAASLAAVAVGFVNGVLISRFAVPAFIGTLGMYGIARGVGFLAADGNTVPTTNAVNSNFGNQFLFGVMPLPVLVTVIIVIFMHYLLSRTRFGQYTYAIGGNRNAAIRAGINVSRHTIALYMLTALLAGVAGILYTARFTAGAAQAGEPTLLDAIAAVVIGGASLFGGEGTIRGTVIGALIIAVIQFGLVFINVPPFYQFIAVGSVIIISVLVDQARRSVVKT
jgi:ribose transport system permease protein